MKKSKRLLSLLITLGMVFCCIISAPSAFAASDTHLVTGYSEYGYTFDIADGKLTFSNIPKTSEYAYSMFIIYDADDDNYSEIHRDSKKVEANQSVSYDLPALTDGNYDAIFFFNSQQDGFYRSLGDVRLVVLGGTAKFYISPVLDHNKELKNSEKTAQNILEFYLEDFYDSDSVEQNAIDTLAAQITSGTADNYKKALLIHDWVSENLYYDLDFYYGNTEETDIMPYDVLQSRVAVCSGYSYLADALLRSVGIPAKVVIGYGGNKYEWASDVIDNRSINHAWTEAYINGRWIIIDTTWDSTNKYENGQKTAGDGIYHNYFDASLEAFSFDHKLEFAEDFPIIYSINTIENVRNVANKSAKTAKGLNLPETVTIFTDGNGENELAEVQASIVWDVDNCDYNPMLDTAQDFVVNGTVIFPEISLNYFGISPAVTVHVYVKGRTPDITVTSLSVKSMPSKLTYNTSDIFDSDGLVVSASYSSGGTFDVTGYNLDSGFDGTIGIKRAVITFDGAETGFFYRVKGDDDNIGDIDGDKSVTSNDLLMLQQHLLGTNCLSGDSLNRSMLTLDQTIDSNDLLALQQHILGIVTIN